MHLLVRETQTLDEQEDAVDLGQTPADLVFLSFSDSDLGAAAAAWEGMAAPRPSLRLANLARLRHPMSVDLYAERVIAHARCVVGRLLGGLDYWRYGAEEIAAQCARAGVPLAILPGDGRADAQLAGLSTIETGALARLAAYLDAGGAANVGNALRLAAHLGGLGDDPAALPAPLPRHGLHPFAGEDRADAVIVFYRSHLLAGDVAPITAMANALAARGMAVQGIHVGSLKDPDTAAFVTERLRAWRPAVVLNATGFSARRDAAGSPLDAADAPVLQLVLAGSSREAWARGFRGLTQSDLAMQVVLPELDGRLLTTAISFKAPSTRVPGLEFERTLHAPHPAGIAAAADRACGWARLAATPPNERRIALVVSDYPGAGGQIAHAVGLDTFASIEVILGLLRQAGHACDTPKALVDSLCHAEPAPIIALPTYERLFAALPSEVRERVIAAWGQPSDDIALRHVVLGNLVVAVQPDRGSALDRRSTYHDPDLPPAHAYIAFHLWLRHVVGVDAIIHLGTHGTLEWLPGKSVALGGSCFPAALLGGVPVIYPFIVNNPGEAASAKRRLGAVTIGHLTPPLMRAGTHGDAAELETLIDEYAAADGLDRRRAALLRRDILERAEASGLLVESGASRDLGEDAALARLDAYLCDVKDLQIRDGLHVFATPPARRAALLAALCAACPAVARDTLESGLDACAEAEAASLLAALDGRFVPPGPAGAPTRGRADVLPTGRNLFAVDPRAVPTRSALELAERVAADLLRRHLQDHGDWPRSLVLDLWGSATMRTGGEDFALALVLIGARPLWDTGSGRVSGFEIVPLALLDRPRVDVTLRISGLFRDAFEAQILLFDAAVRAIAARDEAAEWNPLAASAPTGLARVFGPPPGTHGAGVAALLDRGGWNDRTMLAEAYLAASSTAYGRELDGAPGAAGFAARVAAAEAFVHQQDHGETDLLDSTEYAAHEGGFAAAAAELGGRPALYHADTSRPEAPRTRTLGEEIARVVRGRAANPAWIAGMVRHGYRGAAEIARALDALHGFAATVPARFDAQFELLFDATLADAAVAGFMRRANPDAHAAMTARFLDALDRDLWRPRRNAIRSALLESAA